MTPQTELRSGFKHDEEYELGSKALDEFAAEGERDLAAEAERVVFRVEGERVFRVERGPDFGVQREPDEPPMWVADSTPEVRPRPIVAPRIPARRWPIFIPLAVGVVAVSAGYGLASWDVGLPVLPSAPARWAIAEPQRAPIPVPELPPSAIVPAAVGGSLQPSSDRASGNIAQASGATAAGGDTVPASAGPLRAAVDEALAGVSRSFRARDAASLTQVWPGADVAGLSRRFSTLKYQSLSFDRCDVRPVGGQIVASCEVSIAAAANAGDPALQRRRESWSIVFDRSGDRYVIGSVTTR